MTSELFKVSWPIERLGDALTTLGAQIGLSSTAVDIGEVPASIRGGVGKGADAGVGLDRWVATVAARLGLEAEAVEASYPEFDRLVQRCAPALLRIESASGPRFLALTRCKRRKLSILGPDLALHEATVDAVRSARCKEVESPAANEVDRILDGADIPSGRRPRSRQALLDEILAPQRMDGCWLIRPAGSAPLESHARQPRLVSLCTTLVAAHALHYVLWIFSWWLLGRGVLEGHLDRGWLVAWGLILLTLIPFRLLAAYAGGLLSVRAGAVLKRRLLYGAFRLEPEEVRHLGTGQLLGRVMELEVVEQMAITGGFLAVTALIELGLSAFVLAVGAGGWLHLLLLVLWMAVTGWVGFLYFRRRKGWTDARLAMTNDLVEGMVGHRTRLAQEAREQWNNGEDQSLDRYVGASKEVDRAAASLQALVPRGWFILGILGLVPAFAAGAPVPLLAIGVGGVILAFQAFRDLSEGLERILAAVVAWERIRPFWRAASRPERVGQPEYAAEESRHAQPEKSSPSAHLGDQPCKESPFLDARDLVFRHSDRAEPVLRGADLRVYAGDRILLQGPSGAGKSTLGMLLASIRCPDSGLLLLEGLDLQTLGHEGWRRRVIMVPQFHENHVLMGTFAFNVLMGRGWPPRQRDLEEAEQICRSIGLGPLLERMPAGLQQIVGDTGWQLSHGERDRLYVARALLQGAEVLILDESFSALDPGTLSCTLGFVLESAPTLIAIAHP